MKSARDAIITAVASAALAAASSSGACAQAAGESFSSILGGFEADFSGAVDIAAAAGDSELARDGPYFDIDLDLNLETVADSGLRIGASFGARAKRDSGRRGFARVVGECPSNRIECPAAGGRPIAGRVTGLHADPVLDPADVQVRLDTAAGYIKGGWGEARIGLADGAAALETVALPGAFRLMRADAPRVDPSGLTLASTAHALSGSAAKITVRTRRLAGFRASVSYTPDADWCGVDDCALSSRPAFASPQTEDVWEAGASFERYFRSSGQRWRLSGGFAEGQVSPDAPAVFDDPWTASIRLAWARGDLALGAGWMRTNDGVSNGDYEAVSASASLERGAWLAAVEFAAGRSDLVNAEGWSAQIGASRYSDAGFLIGFGLARTDEAAPFAGAAGLVERESGATLGFIETGWRF